MIAGGMVPVYANEQRKARKRREAAAQNKAQATAENRPQATPSPEGRNMSLADKLEPRIRVTVTRSLAFAALCGIARAPRFWLGVVGGFSLGALAATALGALG